MQLALAVGALAAGCGGPGEKKTRRPPRRRRRARPRRRRPDAGPPVRGDWLVIHIAGRPREPEPAHLERRRREPRCWRWIFPPLIRVDPQTLELAPRSPRRCPKISPDHLSYEYTLREDVTFSDGKPLTAEDVVFTLKADAPSAR